LVTDKQVRRLFALGKVETNLETAAAKAGMDAKAARKYRRLGRVPSELTPRGMGDRNSSVRIRIGRRRIEGNEEQEQPAASSGTCPPSASSPARTYALSLGGGLDFCQSALDRPAASSQEGRTDGVSNRISGEIESKKHYRNPVRTVHSLVLGVRGCPKQTLPKSANCFEILVSAAGFEPATHALKGRCSTT
jgi:hypothetical protein